MNQWKLEEIRLKGVDWISLVGKRWRDLEKAVLGLCVAKRSGNSLSTEEHLSRNLLHALGLYETSYIQVAARYHFIANPT
jgi:hypothetical protein